MNKIQRIEEKIAKKELVLGTHSSLGYPVIAEMLGEAGFDALWIDTEHTAIDRQDLLLNVIATEGTQMAPFVRIPWNDPVLAKPVLEMGVAGIIFPFIRTAEEAKLAVASCTYPPDGIRGFGPIRAVRYGNIDTMEYIHTISKQVWKILQIEHVDAVKNIDEILAVKGVSAVVIGPNDLSGSIGLLGQPGHPQVRELIEVVAGKCSKAGIPFGVSTGYNPNDKKSFEYWIGLNVQFIFLGGDTAFLMSGARQTIQGVNEILKE